MNNMRIYLSLIVFIICFIISIFLWIKLGIKQAIIDVLFFGVKLKGRSTKKDDDKTVPLMQNKNKVEETEILKKDTEETTVLNSELIILEEIKFVGKV